MVAKVNRKVLFNIALAVVGASVCGLGYRLASDETAPPSIPNRSIEIFAVQPIHLDVDMQLDPSTPNSMELSLSQGTTTPLSGPLDVYLELDNDTATATTVDGVRLDPIGFTGMDEASSERHQIFLLRLASDAQELTLKTSRPSIASAGSRTLIHPPNLGGSTGKALETTGPNGVPVWLASLDSIRVYAGIDLTESGRIETVTPDLNRNGETATWISEGSIEPFEMVVDLSREGATQRRILFGGVIIGVGGSILATMIIGLLEMLGTSTRRRDAGGVGSAG